MTPEDDDEHCTPGAPVGLTGTSVELGDDTYVILSYPIAPPLELPAALTQAERAVVKLLSEGHRSPAIALLRDVSLRTVANQLHSVYRKLGVGSRAELIALLHRVQ
jgi:DNA-binding CsgD family transcriptional regulator